MSLASTLSKAFTFLTTILSKTSAVDATFQKLAPMTKAAVLATFYDATKTVATAGAAVTEAETGNITGAITLSEATVAMVQSVITDGKADLTILQNITTALKADL